MTTPNPRPTTHGLRPLQIVLIATSLEEESDLVVRSGLALARAAGAQVFLVHAAPLTPRLDLELGFGPAIQEQVAGREEALERQIERLGIGVSELAGTAVQIGVAHRILTRIAQASAADLIVLGATRTGALAAELLGSTADRVLRKAARPVLVVRGELAMPPHRVLAPVDLSPLSAESFRAGWQILSQLSSGAETSLRVVYALSILDVLAHRSREASGIPLEEERQRYAEELGRFVEENRGDGSFQVETAVLPGEARFEILQDLERHPADLALLGTHGSSGFERLVLGSVAATVAGKAPCSVLLIPPAAAAEPEPEPAAG